MEPFTNGSNYEVEPLEATVHFTLSGAAKEVGVSKSTLSKALSTGRLSGERLEDGSFRIDAAELFRAFPRRTVEANARPVTATVPEPPGEPAERLFSDASTLELKVRMLEEQISRERALRDQERETSQETIQDLRRRLDRSEERVLALSVTRVEQGAVAPPARPSPSRARSSFLDRLFGRG